MDSGTGDKPLRKISEAFNAIANTINSQHQQPDLELASFSRACSLVSPLFRCLGIAFKFAEMDYVAKVNDLCETSVSVLTLQSMMAKDIENNCVRKPGSHTRNLLRVKRGLDMVRVLFEQILASDTLHCGPRLTLCSLCVLAPSTTMVLLSYVTGGHLHFLKQGDVHKIMLPNDGSVVEHAFDTRDNSLKNPASKAYGQVFSPYHGWAIRKAVAAGMYALPTKQQLLQKLNEDEVSARTEMQNYVTASAIVIMYIDKLFQSRNLGIDW